MTRKKHSREYDKLNDEITDLTFLRAFPTIRLSQIEWEATQAQIIEKKTQLAEIVAKENS
jgi:hypothetical protein